MEASQENDIRYRLSPTTTTQMSKMVLSTTPELPYNETTSPNTFANNKAGCRPQETDGSRSVDFHTSSSVDTTMTATTTGRNSAWRNSIGVLVQLYGLSRNRTEEISHLVELFCADIVDIQRTAKAGLSTDGALLQVDVFSCPVCFGILTDPVTTHCGHTYCKKCLQKETGQMCKRCNVVFTSADTSDLKINVLIVSLVEKWWSSQSVVSSHRNEGNQLCMQNHLKDAVVKYNEALNLNPHDHLTLGNRSHALLTLGNKDRSLLDAEAAIRICPFWAKGYFRKSVALISLGRYEEAFLTLVICLYFIKATKLNDETTATPVKIEIMQVLHKIFLDNGGFNSNAPPRRHSLHQVKTVQYPNPKKQRLEAFAALLQRQDHDCDFDSDDNQDEDGDERMPVRRSTFSSNTGKCFGRKEDRSTPQSAVTTLMSTEQSSERMQRLFDRAMEKVEKIQSNILTTRAKVVPVNCDNGNVRVGYLPAVSPISLSDFECTLCYRLFHQPVTTSCGHTYCRSCLQRSLDHSPACPLCKSSLQECLAQRDQIVTQFLDVCISAFFPNERNERLTQHLEEIAEAAGRNAESEVPIFVCTMAFPNVPCPLHVFEPRYRLMIRRCMESGSRQFGMCCYLQDAENHYANYGTLLQVRNVQYFPDGRSVVDTIGSRRFHVMRKSMKDGYHTSAVELLTDNGVAAVDRTRLEETHTMVYQEASDWLISLNHVLKQRIHTHFGMIPTPEENWMDSPDGPSWCWWLLAILPLDTKAQLAILSMNSLQKRLDSIHKVLCYVKSHNI